MQEIHKFDAEISVISNGLEKYIAFTWISFLLTACNLWILEFVR